MPYTFSNLPLASVNGEILPFGVNDVGQIVGYNDPATSGFLYSGGSYTTLSDPLGTGFTEATGINDATEIVGIYENNSGTHGFLYSGGTYTSLDDPLGTY